MSNNEIEITILKYETVFTTRSKDLKKHLWFSFPNDYMTHPDFMDINGDEFKWFLWAVSLCSKVNKNTIRLHISHTERLLTLKRKDLFSMIEKLQGKQIDIYTRPRDGLETAAGRPLHNKHNKQTNNIPDPVILTGSGFLKGSEPKGNKDVFDALREIEYLYKNFYPRKEGKSAGIKILQKQIKTPQDVKELELAIKSYANKNKKTEKEFIKHFDSFARHWRDELETLTKQEIKIITVFDQPASAFPIKEKKND